MDKLAEAVLAEVPDQLVGFMTERGLKPGMKPSSLYEQKDGDKDPDAVDQSHDPMIV